MLGLPVNALYEAISRGFMNYIYAHINSLNDFKPNGAGLSLKDRRKPGGLGNSMRQKLLVGITESTRLYLASWFLERFVIEACPSLRCGACYGLRHIKPLEMENIKAFKGEPTGIKGIRP